MTSTLNQVLRGGVASAAILAVLLGVAPDAGARPGFHAGGMHFGGGFMNIAPHFRGGFRPEPGLRDGTAYHGIRPELRRELGPELRRELRPEERLRPIPEHGGAGHHGGGGHNHPKHPYWPGYWAGVAAGAAATAATGAWVYTLPASCTAVSVNGVTYENCSNTWYRPKYAGSQVVYEVVEPPR
uniref:hypothetical protein n=1 Tax=Microbulbifer agarilyticus TaxID=260552 RepID=UPI000255B90A|nr:hypothetical protein [Microbulbifer agarilyticus]